MMPAFFQFTAPSMLMKNVFLIDIDRFTLFFLLPQIRFSCDLFFELQKNRRICRDRSILLRRLGTELD
jgi:hypothetical protein